MRSLFLIPKTMGAENMRATVQLLKEADPQYRGSLAPMCIGLLAETVSENAEALGLPEFV